MKKFILLFIIIVPGFGWWTGVTIVHAQQISSPMIKFPYAKGESFVVTQGYHSPPTHINKDAFALDLTQNGCDAYGKPALTAISGTVLLAQDAGYDGGYGTQILLKSRGNLVTRYAHMIPGSLMTKAGDVLPQGTPIGEIGNSGLVAGNACAIHPGTHIHFAVDTENPDGTFTAKNPEPISGYTDLLEGHWYLSDNALSPAPSNRNLTAIALQTSKNQIVIPPNEDAITSSSAKLYGTADPSQSTNNSIVANQGASPDTTQTPALPSNNRNEPASLSVSVGVTSTVMNSSSSNLSPTSTPDTINDNADHTTQTQTPAPTKALGGGVSVVPSTNTPPGGVTSTAPFEATSTAPSSTIVTTSTEPETPDASSSAPTASSSVPLNIGAPQIPVTQSSTASFNSSTLAIDLAWQVPYSATTSPTATIYSIFLEGDAEHPSSSPPLLIATTTIASFSYAIPDADFGKDVEFAVQATDGAGNISALTSTTISIPAWLSSIQPVDDNESFPSWYSDNWYDLGTGFTGTIRSLALEGYINSDQYGASTVALEEFSDAGYTSLDHTFPISPTPFTQVTQKIIVPDLTIPLQSDKYYRLTTVQSYQNRSVILKGTDATGTGMWNNYAYGVGRVQYQYPFYPYLSTIIDPEELPILPPVMQGNPTPSFNAANSQIDVSWPAAIDADEPNVALNYEVNLSTSTTFDPTQWQSVGNGLSTWLNVVFPNAYTIGVRALDDFNDPSEPSMASWNFPSDYTPAPTQFDHSAFLGDQGGSQEISFSTTTTVSQVNFWLAPEPEIYCCSQTFLSVYKDVGGQPGDEIPSGNPTVTFDKFNTTAGEEGYLFSSPITFSPGIYWFSINPSPGISNPTKIYGSNDDSYSGGYWSNNPKVDAYFRIIKASGP